MSRTVRMPRSCIVPTLLTLGLGASVAFAQEGTSTGETGSPLADVHSKLPEDIRAYDTHLITLAGPYMQGRVPGSEGMERAKDYVQYNFERAGLIPGFPDKDGNAFATFRDPFPLGGTTTITNQTLDARRMNFEADKDFVFTGLGAEGMATGDAVLVGYSIDNGPDGFTSYPDDIDLTGKIAVMFRFEPMGEDGVSLFNAGGGGWSNAATFDGKLRAAAQRGAEGIIIINTPGADDPRVARLSQFSNGRASARVPVVMKTAEAADKLVGDRDLMALRRDADKGAAPLDLGVELTIGGDVEREALMAENVGGVLRGQGGLEDEWIVVGAHLDHLGMGYFGSREGPGKLHPGADDNASGSAGLILLADKLAATFEGDDRPRRSILIVAFSGEESGLNGSRHYVTDPIAPNDDHVLMVNWDMIGRVLNERLVVSGAFSADGLQEFIQPMLDASGLEIVVPPQMSGASDHTPFYNAGIPILFSIIADFHADYHTPQDVVWKINRTGAVKTVRMYHDIVAAVATRPDRFEFVSPQARRAPQPDAPDAPVRPARVRVGIVIDMSSDESGITIGEVAEGGAAQEAGLAPGDRIVRWDGQKILDLAGFRELLGRHEPGDVVNVGVMRGGDEETIEIELKGR